MEPMLCPQCGRTAFWIDRSRHEGYDGTQYCLQASEPEGRRALAADPSLEACPHGCVARRRGGDA